MRICRARVALALSCCHVLAGALMAGSSAGATVIDLSVLPEDIRLNGTVANDETGKSVVVGDFNGDGRDDMIVGVPGTDFKGRSGCGAINIILSSDTLNSPVELSSARTDLKRIFGPSQNSLIGTILACGDVNGDNRDDIICGFPTANAGGRFSAGEVFIIYGSAVPADTVDLAAPGPGVTAILGLNVFDRLGSSVAVGDVNNDTYGDIIAGAPFATAPAGPVTGKVFVVYGEQNMDAVIDLPTTAKPFTQIFGENSNNVFGTSCGAADINDDTFCDILVGAPEAAPLGRTAAGIAYVIPGAASMPDTIETVTAPSGGIKKIFGEQNDALTGSRFASGNVNTSGTIDIIVGASGFSPPGRSEAGAVYLIPGLTNLPDTTDLAAPPANVCRIEGPSPNFNIGLSIASYDFNMDTIEDVVIGVPLASPLGRNEAGTVFIVFGRTMFPAQIDLSVTQPAVTSILGAAPLDHSGRSVAAGTINLDNFGDLLIGADNASIGGMFAVGKALVIFGSSEITPTQLLYYGAAATTDRVRLEWMIRDDWRPSLLQVQRTGPPADVNFPTEQIVNESPGRFVLEDTDVEGGQSYRYTVLTTETPAQFLFEVTVRVPDGRRASLDPVFPNPFRSRTTLPFHVPERTRVAIRIYDVSGGLVSTVAEDFFDAGRHERSWDGRNHRGQRAPSGVYFARMTGKGIDIQRKVLLVR